MPDVPPVVATPRPSVDPATGVGPPVPGDPLRSWRGRFGLPAVEPLALHGYRRERLRELSFPVAAALMEGGFVGVVADKVYHVHPVVLSLISAAPMFGNLSSFVWARLAQGRPKVSFLVRLHALFVACVALMALLPAGPRGSWLLVTSMVSARLVLGGIVTIRSLVWTLNYPRQARGRVTARLHLFAILIMTGTSVLGSLFLDASPQSFRWVYALGASLAVIGVVAFSGVRVIAEESQLSLERRARRVEDGAVPGGSPWSAWGVLRRDPLFARYQACQFVLGVANMMIQAPLVYLVSRELQASYTTSIAIVLAIPLAFSMATLAWWAAYLDRVHVSEFRARHSWLWVVAQFLTWVGALRGSLAWLVAGSVVFGLARGGGALAWNLGHNDFADRESLGHYMGIHVTLTGLRGAFAPFLGMLLYLGWSGVELPGIGLRIPGFAGIHAQAILLACLLSALGAFGYVRLNRRIQRHLGSEPDPR